MLTGGLRVVVVAGRVRGVVVVAEDPDSPRPRRGALLGRRRLHRPGGDLDVLSAWEHGRRRSAAAGQPALQQGRARR